MDRIKLEYLLRNMDIKDRKKIYFLIDLKSLDDFNKYSCKFLQDTETKDSMILSSLCFLNREENIKYYVDLFEKINKVCIENNVYPIFSNPQDLSKCEEERRDLIKLQPEEELNKFFKVSHFIQYKPQVYCPPQKKQ